MQKTQTPQLPLLSEKIRINSDLMAEASLVNELIGPLLTPERRQKIDRVIQERCQSVAVVLEGIYDRGNVSAVMRTAEAFGFVNFHVIETQEKFKEANRVTQGADKWVEVQKWSQTTDCVRALKSRGFKICVTSLEASRPMSEVDWTVPTAFVLGNEKHGVSPEMLEMADERIIIPMTGFVQSFNISVAGALGLYHIFLERQKKHGRVGDLSPAELEVLRAHYYLRTQDSALDILENYLLKRS